MTCPTCQCLTCFKEVDQTDGDELGDDMILYTCEPGVEGGSIFRVRPVPTVATRCVFIEFIFKGGLECTLDSALDVLHCTLEISTE